MAPPQAERVPTGPYELADHLADHHLFSYEAVVEFDSDMLRQIHRQNHHDRSLLAPNHRHQEPLP